MADGGGSGLSRPRLAPRLLASVRDAGEARAALAGGAAVIDLKEPGAGALGAVPLGVQRQVVRSVAGRRWVSATAGDPPLDPWRLRRAVLASARAGVDVVKVGIAPGDATDDTLRALAPLARRYRIVAVAFADRGLPPRLVERLATAGLAGVMLDTAGKAGGRLTELMGVEELSGFVAAARRAGLLAGLAGSLRLADLPALATTGADLVGLRGALCAGGREGRLQRRRVAAAARALAAGPASAAASPRAVAGPSTRTATPPASA